MFGPQEVPRARSPGNHLALTVRGLPAPECPDGVWFVDVGLGDALHEPLPLRAGATSRARSATGWARRWRCRRLAVSPRPGRQLRGMDFGPARSAPADFTGASRRAVDLAESPFVRDRDRAATSRRRRRLLVGCRLTRLGAGEPGRREFTTPGEWFGVLAELFGLPLPDVSRSQRRDLWARVWAAHEAWTASREPEAASAPGTTRRAPGETRRER